MKITVLGSGTSMGIPTMACHCDVCRSADPRDRRLRSSILIEEAGYRLLVDCTTDFREQSLRLDLRDVDALLLTHGHTDHVGGLDELRVFCLAHQKELPIHGPAYVLEDLVTRLPYAFAPPKQTGGGVPRFVLHPVGEDDVFTLGPFRIETIPVKHGVIDVFGYRFKGGNGDFVYVTDASAISAESRARMKGCRVMILNALRHKPHSTHLSLGEAVEIAKEAGSETTYFIHMAHNLAHEKTNAELPPGMALSYDGLVFEV